MKYDKALIDVGSFDNKILKALVQPTDSKDIIKKIQFENQLDPWFYDLRYGK